MATTREARAKVGLDYSSFEKGAGAVTRAANSMSSAVKVALAAIGIEITFSAIKDSLMDVINLGEMTANAGKKAGIAAGQWYLFNKSVEKGVSLKTMGMLIGENAAVLDRSANVFRDVAIKLWVVGEKVRGFWLGLLDKLAPVLSKLLDGALAQNLVSAGQRFGEAISDALKVIYQLADDGVLWESFKLGFKIAFDYAVERTLWLAGITFDIFKETIACAWSEGLDAAWTAITNFISNFGKLFGETIANAFKNTSTRGLYTTAGVVTAAAATGGVSLIPSLIGALAGSLVGDLLGDDEKPKAFGSSKKESVAQTKLNEIKERNSFRPSQDLANQITVFSETVAASIAKFNRNAENSPANTYENQTRQQTFGVDSLAAIGAGGNVALGLSVLSVQQRQLLKLEEISEKLGPRQISGAQTPVMTSRLNGSISREQTRRVVGDY